jgi:hypothetical protein
MIEFACTCGPVLGTPALAGSAGAENTASKKISNSRRSVRVRFGIMEACHESSVHEFQVG